jgi:predicted transcriptional regulator YdeE
MTDPQTNETHMVKINIAEDVYANLKSKGNLIKHTQAQRRRSEILRYEIYCDWFANSNLNTVFGALFEAYSARGFIHRIYSRQRQFSVSHN